MSVMWTLLGVALAAAAGVLVYRCGVEDGVRLCKTARRAHIVEREKAAKPMATDVADQQRKLLQMMNFMQYDGSEMPKVKGGDGQ